jgi:hypothetical protein
VKSKEEAIHWATRAPAPFGNDQDGEIEIRQLFESSDFPSEAEHEQMLRDRIAAR